MNTKGRIVPGWTIGLKKGGYGCADCHTEFTVTQPLFITNDRGVTMFNQNLRCLICNATDKEPSPKMTEEELEMKKAEIKSRLQNE